MTTKSTLIDFAQSILESVLPEKILYHFRKDYEHAANDIHDIEYALESVVEAYVELFPHLSKEILDLKQKIDEDNLKAIEESVPKKKLEVTASEIILSLDKIARTYNHNSYGLPINHSVVRPEMEDRVVELIRLYVLR